MSQLVNLGSSPLIGKIQRYGMILTILGALGLGAAYAVGGGLQRMMGDYVLGFWYFAGISVTMIFFSALQYLTRAGWSSSIRRVAENFAGMIPFMLLGFVPVIINLFSHSSIYEWTHESALTDPILIHKAGYLNTPFFVVRLAIYALLWFGMYRVIVGNSIKQDSMPGDNQPTEKAWKLAAPMVLIYALSISFCSFDLLMSLEPHWFSTMFGVYTFAGHFVAAISVITLMTVALYRAGHLKGFIREEHFHDLGKLMFAFSVFWTYIAFSQYFIIWYANLPEETIYFTARTTHGWQYMGIALVVMHFVVPFMVLLRQDVKRKTNILVAAAIIILISHYIDLAWIILPAVGHVSGTEGMMFGWQELTGWVFFAGLFMMLAARSYKKYSALAVNDPVLAESKEYLV
ncbi:membrane protein [soil metagenome]